MYAWASQAICTGPHSLTTFWTEAAPALHHLPKRPSHSPTKPSLSRLRTCGTFFLSPSLASQRLGRLPCRGIRAVTGLAPACIVYNSSINASPPHLYLCNTRLLTQTSQAFLLVLFSSLDPGDKFLGVQGGQSSPRGAVSLISPGPRRDGASNEASVRIGLAGQAGLMTHLLRGLRLGSIPAESVPGEPWVNGNSCAFPQSVKASAP